MSDQAGKREEARLVLGRPVLVYLPCYNCAGKILMTLDEIPHELHGQIECLVIDNCSTDGTAQTVLNRIQTNPYPFRVHLIRPGFNAGYAGSQKLAYSLAVRNPSVRHVIMLHGDGQYPSHFIRDFIPFFDSDYALVNGYRSKKAFPEKEETPWPTYIIIKFLSACESFLLRIAQMEWHSGFVMYRRDFLERIPLSGLSSTAHIDGELIMCAAALGARTTSIPLYKRYKDFEAFGGLARMKHIVHTAQLILKYKRGYYKMLLSSHAQRCVDTPFEVLG